MIYPFTYNDKIYKKFYKHIVDVLFIVYLTLLKWEYNDLSHNFFRYFNIVNKWINK